MDKLSKIDQHLIGDPCSWITPYLIISWIITQLGLNTLIYSMPLGVTMTHVSLSVYIATITGTFTLISFILFNIVCKKRLHLRKKVLETFMSGVS